MPVKTYWITGASTGIGAALAQRLAHAGHIVAASARSTDKLAALAAQDYGAGRVVSYPLDLTDAAAVTAAVAAIVADLGRIDCAILNAGTYAIDSVAGFDAAAIAEHLQVNLMGTVHALAGVLPDMRARHAGQIAIVASVAGYRGLPGAIGYGGSKAALINMAEAMRPECELSGIDLRLICPGFVKTRLTDQNRFPMPFLITPDQAATAIERGLSSRAFEIAFPWPMKALMKMFQRLPYGPFFAITRKLIKAVDLPPATNK